jgi:hypothetical protein
MGEYPLCLICGKELTIYSKDMQICSDHIMVLEKETQKRIQTQINQFVQDIGKKMAELQAFILMLLFYSILTILFSLIPIIPFSTNYLYIGIVLGGIYIINLIKKRKVVQQKYIDWIKHEFERL